MEQQYQLLAVLITFLLLDSFFVGLRCWVRIKLVKAFGLDDWFMAIAMVNKGEVSIREVIVLMNES